MAVGRITLRARKAMRSAAAKKGWETRRQRVLEARLRIANNTELLIDRDAFLREADRVGLAPGPKPRPAGIVRRWWQWATGWMR